MNNRARTVHVINSGSVTAVNKGLGPRDFHIEATTKTPVLVERMSSTNSRLVSKISISAIEWRKLCDGWTGTVNNGGSLFRRTNSRKQMVIVVNSYAFSKSLTMGKREKRQFKKKMQI